jgi:hypothetical protein
METNGSVSDPLLLTCWKDIAQYMGKGVRTVQRWEQQLDLPVRRPRGSSYKSAVMARAADLDLWLASRWSRRSEEEHGHGSIRINLESTIQTARELRAAHGALLHDVSSEVQMLIRKCQEMKKRQGTNGNSE